ncbi:MAG: signal peptidase I [Opitutales bacterium]
MHKPIIRFLKRQWREWRNTVLFFVCVVVPVKSSLADWNWVPTGSMNPTIVEGDLVYVNKLAYDLRVPLTKHSLKHFADPERGDIAVLLSPEDETRLVKRVIGVPGDTLEMWNNTLYVNGVRADYSDLAYEEIQDLEEALRAISLFAEENIEGHAHSVMITPGIPSNKRSFAKVTVPDGHYFIMGDNRDNSHDSRAYGCVERSQFLGEATHVLVSFNMLDKYQPRLGRFFTGLN